MLAANPHVAPSTLFAVLSSLILSVAGATALTNYIDRDIDAIMERTKRRPLPSRMIDPPSKALYLGALLLGSSLIPALTINLWFVAFLLLGVIDSVVVYNLLAKRGTYLSIILASPRRGHASPRRLVRR